MPTYFFLIQRKQICSLKTILSAKITLTEVHLKLNNIYFVFQINKIFFLSQVYCATCIVFRSFMGRIHSRNHFVDLLFEISLTFQYLFQDKVTKTIQYSQDE